MLAETKNIIEILKNDYNFDTDAMIKAIVPDSSDDSLEYIYIDNPSYYTVNKGMPHDDGFEYTYIYNQYYVVHKGMPQDKLESVASYIAQSIPTEFKVYLNKEKDDSATEKVEESLDLDQIQEDSVYVYDPKYKLPYINEEDDLENETKLQTIAKYQPYCKVKEVLIVSKEEEDGFALVTFDIDENKDKNIPEDLIKEDYVVFAEDLEPVGKLVGVGMEVNEAVSNASVNISESNSSSGTNETSTALLTALNSEKEAVMTYEMLITMSTDEDEKELLKKILEDEKEHIALLSGLQSSKVADSVAEDNKETLDSYAEDIIETPAL